MLRQDRVVWFVLCFVLLKKNMLVLEKEIILKLRGGFGQEK